VNASLVTIIIALIFVALGNVNAVAEIISMFFMVTYGSLCLISFLNHFGASPSYRPSFRSRWYFSLIGFIVSIWVMFKINTPYALAAILLMTLVYIYINHYHSKRKGMEALFANSIFQLNRNLQVYLQKSYHKKEEKEWRPSAICISKNSFERDTAFQLLNWISYKYGFGTYLHRIEGYFSRTTFEQAREELAKLISRFDRIENHVYVDTIISPSYTSAIAQAIQLPGISGMENNIVIFEYDKENPVELEAIIENFSLVNAGSFDICILASSPRKILHKNGIHVWIKPTDATNGNLMILISYIISGHPEWRKSHIKIFEICRNDELDQLKENNRKLIEEGRIPISEKNIEIITEEADISPKRLINEYSSEAALTIIGFREEALNHEGITLFDGYNDLGTILFINSHDEKIIE
jgi:ABC-type multidrug transport system fused ATPase/permease subunit